MKRFVVPVWLFNSVPVQAEPIKWVKHHKMEIALLAVMAGASAVDVKMSAAMRKPLHDFDATLIRPGSHRRQMWATKAVFLVPLATINHFVIRQERRCRKKVI